MKSNLQQIRKTEKKRTLHRAKKPIKVSSLENTHLEQEDSFTGIFEAHTRGNKANEQHSTGIKLLGIVEAGFPTHAEEDDAETITFDDYLISNKEASYILRVKGDSMIDAGIYEEDLVIVERGRQPKEGDIVIAQIDGDWTMKYYRHKAGKTYLEPANKKYPLLFPDGELTIAAVVTAVVRKY